LARQIWLLRHADAEPHGTRQDSERRLTERGERQARFAGQALARMGVEFDALLSSPKERALRTAHVAARAWNADRSQETLASGEHPRFGQRGRLEVHPPLASGFDAHQALAALAEVAPSPGGDARVLLVGHEPDLSTVVAELTGARIDLKKGGLAVLRMDGSPTHPGGELLTLLRPSELALIAGEGRPAQAAARSR
jgi:phosphohistidine phosphatase